ncbi:MAG: hypothetical protein WC821_00470 [archaeon]|jgi:hypothetical protein
MDIGIILGTCISFLKLLLLVSIISFIGYKIFSPVRQKIAEKFSLSWTKSCLVFNFVFIIAFLLLVFVYFMSVGILGAPARAEDIDYNLGDNILLLASSLPRLIVSSIILSLLLYFFELVASLFMVQKALKKKVKPTNDWVSQFKGVLVASALFLILILFVFDWVPLGLFVYIFYGSLKVLPVLFIVP